MLHSSSAQRSCSDSEWSESYAHGFTLYRSLSDRAARTERTQQRKVIFVSATASISLSTTVLCCIFASDIHPISTVNISTVNISTCPSTTTFTLSTRFASPQLIRMAVSSLYPSPPNLSHDVIQLIHSPQTTTPYVRLTPTQDSIHDLCTCRHHTQSHERHQLNRLEVPTRGSCGEKRRSDEPHGANW